MQMKIKCIDEAHTAFPKHNVRPSQVSLPGADQLEFFAAALKTAGVVRNGLKRMAGPLTVVQPV